MRMFRTPRGRTAGGAVASAAMLSSVYLRIWREESKEGLPDGGVCPRPPEALLDACRRASLMGDERNVSHELEAIRLWHRRNGYNGGVVLRELHSPLFASSDDDKSDDAGMVHHDEHDSRSCYFLYYEVLGTGEIRQQIFCRGTTLFGDVITDLKSVFTWDNELGCRLHLGFRDHADLLLKDVGPLLADAGDRRSTIELCGHSLGGAVAFIAAAKLRKRGYNVVRVTSFGAPNTCDAAAIPVLEALLPQDTLRVESELDGVTLLPPHGRALGDKLWLLNKGGEKYVVRPHSHPAFWWVDSTFFNLLFPETFIGTPTAHRSNSSYVSRLEQLVEIETARHEQTQKQHSNTGISMEGAALAAACDGQVGASAGPKLH